MTGAKRERLPAADRPFERGLEKRKSTPQPTQTSTRTRKKRNRADPPARD